MEDIKPRSEPSKKMEAPKIESGHCPKCGPARKADIVAEHEEHSGNDYVWAVDNYYILRCRGCNSVYVKRTHVFSEDVDYDEDPETGEYSPEYWPTITYWPAPARRNRPPWLVKFKDDQLRELLDEVYSALDGDQPVLAAIGARTTLDRAMVLLGADEAANFAEKLRALQSKGLISREEQDALSTLTDAGSAAAHRAWRPEPEALATIFDGIETFLQRTLILGPALKSIKVPPKPIRTTRRKRDP